MSLAPVPSEGATCANCSAPLVADQRYCLSCGQPCSPVRLAFLDVLQSEHQPQPAAGGYGAAAPVAYAQVQQPSTAPEWLRRYAPLLAVVSVLLLAMIVGLLVGHWVTQSNTPGTQVVKVQGLTAGAPSTSGASASPTATTSTTASAPSEHSATSEAAEVKKEAKAEKVQAKKVEHAKVVKQTSAQAKKLGSSTGAKHAEEVNALGDQPIETGG